MGLLTTPGRMQDLGAGPPTAASGQPGGSPQPSGSMPADESTQQPSSRGTGVKGSSRMVDGSARVEDLRQAAELELGARLSHVPAGLGNELARSPRVDLRSRVRGLKNAVGREDAAALLQSHPALLVHVFPSDVPPRLDALATALQADREAVVRLCSRTKGAGRVLEILPHKTQQRVDAVCSVLQLKPRELLELCDTYPSVLRVGPDMVLARAAALDERLGLDRAQVAELCRQFPLCLQVRSSTVVATVEAVQDAAGVAREEAVRLCLRCPSVFSRSSTSVAATARALQQHIGLQGEEFEKCMVRLHPVGPYLCGGSLANVLTWLQPPLLRCSTSWFVPVSDITPRPHCILTAAVQLLQVLFGIPAKQIASRLEALPAALGIAQGDARRLAQDAARLLLMKADTVAAGWQELRRAASKRPEWREQIGNWTAGTVQAYAAQAYSLTYPACQWGATSLHAGLVRRFFLHGSADGGSSRFRVLLFWGLQ
jgi:hypothetical protein